MSGHSTDIDLESLSVCACGHGWTFDFAAKRVYRRQCEADEDARRSVRLAQALSSIEGQDKCEA